MRVPYSWLREWVPVTWPAPELGSRLTMAGFELEAIEPAAPEFSGVVVGGDSRGIASPAGRQAAGVPRVHWQR